MVQLVTQEVCIFVVILQVALVEEPSSDITRAINSFAVSVVIFDWKIIALMKMLL